MDKKGIEDELDDSYIGDLIKELCMKIEKFYIYPEKSKGISKYILNKLEQGSYNNITDPVAFERLISNDLVDVSNDRHFYFEYDPKTAKDLLKEGYEVTGDDNEDEFPELKHRLKFERYNNWHIIKAERLPGNIGYIKLNDIPPAEFAGEIIVGAFQFLANTGALIFDIRNNGGGYPSMVALISSYLLEPGTKLLTSIFESTKEEPFQSRTLPYIPGKRFPHKPVYILTSSRTASGAEELAYVLKMLKRATIIGETTRGAAHPVELFSILDKFVIWLPIGRPLNPISRDNWEGKGVSPDIDIVQEKALEKAHILALNELIKSESDEELKNMMQFELEYTESMYNSIEINLNVLKDFQGQYERYKIFIQDNQAYFERSNYKQKLITKDNQVYFANEAVRLWFEKDNQTQFIVIERRDFPNLLRLKKS
ncbi:MAG: S41 family peptidase [Promethearchaeota archaeon]|jgi:hypothetical protein